MKSSSKVIIAGILIFALYGIFSNSKNSSDDLYIAPSTNQEMQAQEPTVITDKVFLVQRAAAQGIVGNAEEADINN